jgi:energy-coupling factor transporter ATP-binding protein EcfA2
MSPVNAKTMSSMIQSFSIQRNGWDGSADIDFTETKCCVLTGTNGGGKTLTLKMLKSVGQWIENPTRYNFYEMKNLAELTGILSVKITIRSGVMEGHDSSCETIHWATNWNFESDFIHSIKNQERVIQPIEEGSVKENNDYSIEIAKLTTTEVFFGENMTVNRQESLEMHYMIRSKHSRSEKDKTLSKYFEAKNENMNDKSASSIEPFSPIDFLQLNQVYGPEVTEFSQLFKGPIANKALGNNSQLRIFEPHPHDEIGEYSIADLLHRNGIIISATDNNFRHKAQEINLRVPIMLKVNRNLPNVSSDLENIRNLDVILSKPQNILSMLEEGRELYMEDNNCFSQMSEINIITDPDSNFIEPISIDSLDEIDHQYLLKSQPFFPSWLAFNRFVGYVPESEYLSSGQLQLLAMTKAVLATRSNSLIMIDEPELSLHIDWQRDLVGFFQSIFPKQKFIFSTHSPDILYYDIDQVIQIPPTLE